MSIHHQTTALSTAHQALSPARDPIEERIEHIRNRFKVEVDLIAARYREDGDIEACLAALAPIYASLNAKAPA